jgi:hypothetical protein
MGGYVLPNKMDWWKKLNFEARDSYNVNAVVVHALASCLELSFWLLANGKKGLSEINLAALAVLIDNTRYHLWNLKEVCANLLSIPRGKKGRLLIAMKKQLPRVRLHKLLGNTKDHLAGKYPFYYKWIGVDRAYTDTELDELAHKVHGKEAFEHSNKQFDADTRQMLTYVLRKEGLNRLADAIPKLANPLRKHGGKTHPGEVLQVNNFIRST